MAEKHDTGTQAKLPSKTQTTVAQHVYELAACFPGSLVKLAAELKAMEHNYCSTLTPGAAGKEAGRCDRCDALAAVCGILKVIAAR